MDLKSEDILNVELNVDIDSTILLSYEFEKMKFASELDVESILSVDSNKVIETTNVSKDSGNQDLQTFTNVESVTEELTPDTELEKNKDINGNEEFSPDKNLNQLFFKLELSDSDNEENDEDKLLKLRERGRVGRRSTNSQNRTNHLDRNEKYNRSQINPRNLQFLSGSSFVQLRDTSNNFSVENSQSFILNTSQTAHTFTSSDLVFTPNTVIFEDSTANAVGSPESGYGPSLTGSPPPASVSPNLDLIPETDDDRNIIEFLFENDAECALTDDHNVPSPDIDDRDCKEERIIALVEFLKKTPNEFFDSSNVVDLCGSSVEVASSSNNIECVSLTKNSEDITTYSVALPPLLKNGETPKKLEYKLENKAKNELRGFLSEDEFYAVKARIYRQINEDKTKNREIKVIRVIDEMDKMSENRTNLHEAVLKQNIEKIYCLVEIQKQYKKPLSDINIRDKYGKTALDYAIQNNMTHVVDYLKENTACQSVNV